MKPLGLPMRPWKLRLAVERHTSPSPSTPSWTPKQAPQPGAVMVAPASRRVANVPSAMPCWRISRELGVQTSRTPGAAFLPSRIEAAMRKSLRRPLVQVPM